MEANDSFQNGQESKEIASRGDSPFVGSPGRAQQYYNQNFSNFTGPQKLSANSQKQKCYTEQNEENFRAGVASASMKLDNLFKNTVANSMDPGTKTFEYKQGSSGNSDQPRSKISKEYNRASNPSVEKESTPAKGSANQNEPVKLSSVQVDFSDEGEVGSSSNQHASSSGGDGSQNRHSSSGSRPSQVKASTPFETPQKPETMPTRPDQFDAKRQEFDQRMSKNYLIKHQSEEKKTEARIETDYGVNKEEFKDMAESPSRNTRIKSDTNMIDYLLNLDNLIKNKQSNQLVDEEEEDAKIQNPNMQKSDLFPSKTMEFRNNEKFSETSHQLQGQMGAHRKVVDRNLLELQEYQSHHSSNQNSQSMMRSGSEQTLTAPATSQLETKEGWLLKRSYRSPNLLGWQPRYCVIKGQRFMYFKEKGSKKLDGVIDFNLLTCLITVPKESEEGDFIGLSFKIDILASNRYFEFMIYEDSDEDVLDWLRVLSIHQKNSRGSQIDFTRVAIQPNFWKSLRCSEDDFLKNACSGDILLFKGKSCFSKFQRVLTGGDYDHVAMVFKFSDRIVIFESTGQLGVDLLDWQAFMNNKWHSLYSKLVYRRLHYSLSDDELELLEDFAYKVKGKKYKMNPVKICRRKSNRDAADEIKETKSYFCSELIASAYKRIGLLPEDVSATQYWPGAFAIGSDTELLKDAYLGDEYLIDFSL